MEKRKIWGLWWSFLSAFLWATVYIASRRLMGSETAEIDPVTLSLLRFAAGGAVLWGICFLKLRRRLFEFRLRDYGKIALLSQFSFVGMSIFLFWGQCYTTAVNSSMIMSSSPVLILLLGLFSGERISLLQGLGMAAGAMGCMMVIGVVTVNGFGYSSGGLAGDLLVLVSSFSWACAAILAKRIVTPGNDLAVTAWSLIFASVSLLAIDLCRWDAAVFPHSVSAWLLILYLALFPTALGFFAWNAALSRINLNIVNIMQYLTPVLTIFLAWLFLGETLGGFELAGTAVVLSGVLLASAKRGNIAKK